MKESKFTIDERPGGLEGIAKKMMKSVDLGNIVLPTVDAAYGRHPEWFKGLVEGYDKAFGEHPEIDNLTKVKQMWVNGSQLVWGYNLERDSVAPYIKDEAKGEVKTETVGGETKCQVSCKKLNVVSREVDNSCKYNSLFTVEAVRATRDYTLDENVLLVPSECVFMLLDKIDRNLKRGYSLKVVQDFGGEKKTRVITGSMDLLKKMDSVSGTEGVVAPKAGLLLDLGGFGFMASSATAGEGTTGMTRVSLKALSSVSRVVKKEVQGVLKDAGVERSSVNDGVVNQSVVSWVFYEHVDWVGESPSHENLLKTLGYSGETDLAEWEKEFISRGCKDLSRERWGVLSRVYPGANKMRNVLKWLMGDLEEIKLPPAGEGNDEVREEVLSKALESGLCKLVIRKKSGEMSTMTCTTNPFLFRKVFGENFFAKYDSRGAKYHKFLKYTQQDGVDWDWAAEICGLGELRVPGSERKAALEEIGGSLRGNGRYGGMTVLQFPPVFERKKDGGSSARFYGRFEVDRVVSAYQCTKGVFPTYLMGAREQARAKVSMKDLKLFDSVCTAVQSNVLREMESGSGVGERRQILDGVMRWCLENSEGVLRTQNTLEGLCKALGEALGGLPEVPYEEYGGQRMVGYGWVDGVMKMTKGLSDKEMCEVLERGAEGVFGVVWPAALGVRFPVGVRLLGEAP